MKELHHTSPKPQLILQQTVDSSKSGLIIMQATPSPPPVSLVFESTAIWKIFEFSIQLVLSTNNRS